MTFLTLAGQNGCRFNNSVSLTNLNRPPNNDVREVPVYLGNLQR